MSNNAWSDSAELTAIMVLLHAGSTFQMMHEMREPERNFTGISGEGSVWSWIVFISISVLYTYKFFMSKWKLFSFRTGNGFIWIKKKLEEQESISVPLVFSRSSNTFGCSEHLRLSWWPEQVGSWHIQMWEQTGWLAAIVGVRCFVAVF